MYPFVIQEGITLTLLGLCQLIRRYWKVVIAAPILGLLAAMLLSVAMPPKYEATSSITVNDPSGNVSVANMLAVVNNLAQSYAAPYETDKSDISISSEIGTGAAAQSLVFTVEGSNETECVELANSIASGVAIDAKGVFETLQEANETGLADMNALSTSEDVATVLSGALLQDVLGSGRTFEFCSFMANETIEAKDKGAGLSTLAIAGFVGGFFLAMAIIIVIDAVKRPIRSREELECTLDLRVLNDEGSANLGTKLWANIQFIVDGAIDSVCFVPLDSDSAKVCANALNSTLLKLGKSAQIYEIGPNDSSIAGAEPNRLIIYCCASVNEGVGAAYCAHAASATVVCAHMWTDSLKSLENTLRELSMAKANLTGIALLGDGEGQSV